MIEPTPDFLRAQSAAREHGMTVCGTFRHGKPIYFLAEPDADDARLRELSFEAQHGRTLTPEELRLIALVEAERPGTFSASLEDLPR